MTGTAMTATSNNNYKATNAVAINDAIAALV
jgi:hypothetical protein